MDTVRAHLWISGRFYGDAFRRRLLQVADLLHLNGWLRRLVDGRLEVILEGEGEAVHEAIRACKHGHWGTAVSGVVVRYESVLGEQAGFILRAG